MDGDGNPWPKGPLSHGEDSKGVISSYALLGHHSQQQPNECHLPLEHLPTTATIKQEVLSECEQDEEEEEDTGGSDRKSEALPITVKQEDDCSEFEEWPVTVKLEVESPEVTDQSNDEDAKHRVDFAETTGRETNSLQPTNLHYEQTNRSNVDVAAVAIKEELPIKKEIDFQSPLNDADSVPTARKPIKTDAEMIGCFVLLEPTSSNIHSIAIQNEASMVGSCDGDRTKEDNSETKSFRCHICQKAFRHNCALKTHIRAHTGEKPFECQVCKQAFSQHSHLKAHSRIHTGEKPHQCQVCGKSFRQKTNLRSHFMTHSNDRLHECQVCCRSFVSSSTLEKHALTHTRVKEYQCQVCPAAYFTSQSLATHSRTHTGEKPYECTVCRKTFTQISNFRLHCSVHTGEKPHQCQLCSKTFTRKYTLKYHVKACHKDKRGGSDVPVYFVRNVLTPEPPPKSNN